MARNLGRRVSCDLLSGCPAMILFGKIERSNTTMFIVKQMPLFKNIAKTRNGDEIFIEKAFKRKVLEKIWMIFGRDIVER